MIEYELINCLMVSPDKLDEVLDIVSEKDFQDEKCREILKEMQKLKVFDFNLLRNSFRDRNRDIYEFLLKVFSDYHGVPQNIQYYATTIKEESKKREILEFAEKLKGLTGSEMSSKEIAELVGERILSFYDEKEKGFRHAKDMMVSYLERLVMLKEKGTDISGLTTGWRSLDLASDGMKNGELIIIGARPSQGKSSAMTQIAYHQAVDKKNVVAVFSIESPEQAICDKIISQTARIDTRKLRTGGMTPDEEKMALMYIDILSGSKLFLNDLSSINVHKIRTHIKRLINSGHRPNLVMVDYLQIIETDKGNDTKASKVGRIAQGLKNIAKELNIPVVALAQLNRGVEDGNPTLYSLKESGDIEQIADQVWLLHREEFYKKDKCREEKKGKIDIDIAKNREGQTIMLELNWEGRYTRIYE